MITNYLLLLSALFGICFCNDNPPLTMWRIGDNLEFPICAEIENIVTDLQPRPSISRFCPNKQITVEEFGNEVESCLFEISNNETDCVEKVDPLIMVDVEENEGRCGFENKSVLYKFVYKLCEMKQNSVRILSFKTIYKFCFDHEIKKILYIEHRIFSPTLLHHKELLDERKYGMSFGQDYLDATPLKEPIQEIVDEILRYKKHEQNEWIMFLVDPKDMAFRVWRYPFFHYINAMLLQGDLVPLWDRINFNIDDLAKKKLGEIKIVTGTGVIIKGGESSMISPANVVSAPILWKIVYTESGDSAIAIIVHNVKPDEDIEKLCQPDYCKKIGWQEIFPENFDNFFECCDPSLITQSFNLPSVPALTSMPQYQSVFHTKAQMCHSEKIESENRPGKNRPGKNQLVAGSG